MTVDGSAPRCLARVFGGDEGYTLPGAVELGVAGKAANRRVSGCASARWWRSAGGEFSAVPTFPLAVVLPTYSPSRVPFENFT